MVVTSSSIESRGSKAPALSTWSQAILLLLVAIGAYFQTWVDLWPYWANKNATYTHGTLAALVAVWLAWRARSTVNQTAPAPSARMVPFVVLLSVVWLLAERAYMFIVYATLWPLLAFAVLWAGLGLRVASRFAFPLGFLYFAIPIWDYLKPGLQVITFTMADLLTSVFGIPAAFDGPYVTLPTGTIFIAEDCSGAHFLCVALAIGVLAGVLRGDVLRTRILILIVAGLLSMVFNWLRILLIVLAYLHPSLKDGFETIGHITFGWWVFALDLIVFALVLRCVPRSPYEHAEKQTPDQSTPVRWNNGAGLSIAIIAAVLLPMIAWALPRFDNYPTAMLNADLRRSNAEVDLVSPDLRWRPHYPGAVREERFAIMTEEGIAVEIYSNRYHEQAQGSELISRGSHLFDPVYFSPGSSSIVDLPDSQGQSIPAHRDVYTDSMGISWLSLYTYLVDDEPIARVRSVQLMTALRSMHSRTTTGIVAVATPCVARCESLSPEVEVAFMRTLESHREQYSE